MFFYYFSEAHARTRTVRVLQAPTQWGRDTLRVTLLVSHDRPVDAHHHQGKLPHAHSALASLALRFWAERISFRLTLISNELVARSAFSSRNIDAHSSGAEYMTEIKTPRLSK